MGEAHATSACVICLCEIEVGEQCRSLQCKHSFHPDCILKWFLQSPFKRPTCPTCRGEQTAKTEESCESHVAEDNALREAEAGFASARTEESVRTCNSVQYADRLISL